MSKSGAYEREDASFRELPKFEPGRFHLYVSLACPWASRAVIVRMLKGLEEAIPMTVVEPERDQRGWRLNELFLATLYEQTVPGYEGRISVPVLWDTREERVVNNESADVGRLLNAWGTQGEDLYPPQLRAEMDQLNQRVYETLNNGVYRCGFANSQEAYDDAVDALFETLDWLEERLACARFLMGDAITLADWRLFTTLVRFDSVYYIHFKCSKARLVDYPNLLGYTRELYRQPGIAGTVDMDQIKRHYYRTHPQINPTGFIPAGPDVDFLAPHGRERMSARLAA